MRNRLAQSVLEAKDNEECLPVEHVFATGVDATIQVIDTHKIHNLLGVASSVEGRDCIATPLEAVSAAQKKHRAIDRRVNVAFGSRMPLPLSTVQINMNLSHDCGGSVTHNSQASHPTNVIEAQATLETLKVSEPNASLPQTRTILSGIEKQPRLKASNPKSFSQIVLQQSWDNASFPVQEEPHVDTFATEPVVLEKCLDLTSKCGQKLQKFNRRKEVKIRKHHQFVRHSHKKENSKLREPKEFNLHDSSPRSPPSGWDNYSDGGSDSFLFYRHFEGSPECTNKGTLPHCFTASKSIGGICKEDEAPQALSENGCLMGEGDSYFEKKISCAGRGGLPPLLNWQDDTAISDQLSNIMANKKSCSYGTQKNSSYNHELGSPAFEGHFVGQADGSKSEFAKPAEHVVTTKLQEAGGLLEQNGPFGSTEELWIVHEEGNFGDLASSLTNGLNERVLEQEGSTLKKPGACQVLKGQSITDTKANLMSAATTTSQSTSRCSNNLSSGVPASGKFPLSNIHCVQTNPSTSGNEMKPQNLDLKKPLPSKLEDKELDLLYDPILDCYYDPKTNRYYELK